MVKSFDSNKGKQPNTHISTLDYILTFTCMAIILWFCVNSTDSTFKGSARAQMLGRIVNTLAGLSIQINTINNCHTLIKVILNIQSDWSTHTYMHTHNVIHTHRLPNHSLFQWTRGECWSGEVHCKDRRGLATDQKTNPPSTSMGSVHSQKPGTCMCIPCKFPPRQE